ncbi:hypothetical protein GGR53DRAFT_324818 [Hypoxylon sp. FL1150]|nr:hypothetical protein GGR53DRAFT_324818 [Hypoxylon sp. FL1150]
MDAFRTVWTDVVKAAIGLQDKFPSLKDKSPSEIFSQVVSKRSIVEDNDGPPAYEPVPFKDDPESEKLAKYMDTTPSDEEGPVLQWRPTTSSLRSTYRLLRANRGWRGLWRGLDCAVVHGIFLGLITAAFRALPFGIDVVGFPVASLLTVQFGVAWTHSIIADADLSSFWHRLPPFGLAFRATALPTIVVMLATSVTNMIPTVVNGLIPGNGVLQGLVMAGLWISFYIFLVIPAHVVLVRVRASLLPEGDRVLVPFDKALTLHRAYGVHRFFPGVLGHGFDRRQRVLRRSTILQEPLNSKTTWEILFSDDGEDSQGQDLDRKDCQSISDGG